MTCTTDAASNGNPLCADAPIPDFSAVRPEHVEPAVRGVIAAEELELARLEGVPAPTLAWLAELERVHEAVHRVWAPVEHLNAVLSTPPLRDAYNRSLPLVTELSTRVGQSRELRDRFAALASAAEPGSVEQQLITHALRDFRLAGVELEDPARQRFRELVQSLAQRQAAFEQNLMDATDAFELPVPDARAIAGLPEVVLGRAAQAARAQGLTGWLLKLDPPTYSAVMSHARSEALRAQFYEAWVTRASDRGPHANRWNNGPLIEEILALRHEEATLLGFADYCELSLATKMARSPSEVLEFLRDLAVRSRSQAEAELAELTQRAGRALAPWDVSFYAERLKEHRFELTEEELRPYFPLPRVLEGLFELLGKLFGLRIRAAQARGAWHPDVSYYTVERADGAPIGGLYTDLYARPNKRGGAWMDGCSSRAELPGLSQRPVAHLVCNFNPPLAAEPSLLTHGDVVTLFHEFGHALHHLLTEVDYPSLAGTHGVAWDAVELPSQFLESYAWLPEVLARISGHVRTGEPLPAEKIATLNASRTFLAGLQMVRQLEFALFDFRLHHEYDPARGARVEEVIDAVRTEVAVIKPPEYNRFANTFAHVFGGGYAAGYYSYKWAEVLAADAFAAFEESGSFDRETAARFRHAILASGGSREALDSFVEFRGRAPELEPLLRQSGIAAKHGPA
jgi:oligopeptidase A